MFTGYVLIMGAYHWASTGSVGLGANRGAGSGEIGLGAYRGAGTGGAGGVGLEAGSGGVVGVCQRADLGATVFGGSPRWRDVFGQSLRWRAVPGGSSGPRVVFGGTLGRGAWSCPGCWSGPWDYMEQQQTHWKRFHDSFNDADSLKWAKYVFNLSHIRKENLSWK